MKENAVRYIIYGLLMTRGHYDAKLIEKGIQDDDFEAIADILCCRSVSELKDMQTAYTVNRGADELHVTQELIKMAQKDHKHTLGDVIEKMLDPQRSDEHVLDEEADQMEKDLEFIATTSSFKGEDKKRLALIFNTNSVEYIRRLNEEYLKKSKVTLEAFVDKKLGSKSSAGYFCKTRIQFALDAPVFYQKKIQKLGSKYKKNQNKIADIFINRMDFDLHLIIDAWSKKKYGSTDLKKWLIKSSSDSISGRILAVMLDNCGSYSP